MADYDVDYMATKEEAEEIFHDAEKFLERIKKAIEELK